jgi:archaellum component FlaG (FlaF/FlaG flagellin family)
MFENVDEGHLDKDEDNNFHFYYDREKRIKNAPQIVKDFYAGKNKPVKGIRIFFTKQNRYITFALIFFIAAIFIYSSMNKSRSYAKIQDLDCELSSFVYENQVYTKLNVKRNVKSKQTAPRQVTVDFYIINGDNQIAFTETQAFIYESGEKNLGMKNTDYEILRVEAKVTVDGVEKELSANTKR